ncbi:MAG: type II toxin-antitoxin system VapC family toxin [Verrucomicrobiota bacterium]
MAKLIDTDVLIDYLRGHEAAVTFVEAHASEAYISAMNVAELYQGIRNGKEQAKLSKMLSALTALPITPEIAELGGLFSRDFRTSHGCGLADCLIAATADLHQLTLITLNAKHFPMLSSVETPYQKK